MKTSLDALKDASKGYQKCLQAITKEQGVTIAEWQLLIAVSDGCSTQEKLSEKMHLDTSTLSRQLKRLTAKSALQKEAVGKDRRQLVYSMTEQGLYIKDCLHTAFLNLKSRIFDQWTDEEQNLLKILLNRLDTSINKINQ